MELILVSDEGRRQLRSATSRTCVVRRTYSNYGDRRLAAAGPKLWNSLPTELRQPGSFQRFKQLLKTFCLGAQTLVIMVLDFYAVVTLGICNKDCMKKSFLPFLKTSHLAFQHIFSHQTGTTH